jgi:hypothetical protein
MKKTITKSFLIACSVLPMFQTWAFAIDKNRLDKLLLMSIMSFLQYAGLMFLLVGIIVFVLSNIKIEGAEKSTAIRMFWIAGILLILKPIFDLFIDKL